MLMDGLNLAEGSSVAGLTLVLTTGDTFPVTPVDGQQFRLIQTSGPYSPGAYFYDAEHAVWITGDISSVLVESGLTGGGYSGDVKIGLDWTVLDARYTPQLLTPGVGISISNGVIAVDRASEDVRNASLLVSRTGSTMSGALTLGVPPTVAMHAATKDYVDSLVQGLDPKASVRLATTTNITLSGVQNVDGRATVSGVDRILVKNQLQAAANGIYLAQSGAWTRADDANDSTKVTAGMYCFVEDGVTNGATGWNLVTRGAVLGTTPLAFTMFGTATSYTAGPGIKIEGSTIAIDGSGIPYDFSAAILGKPQSGAIVSAHIAARAFTIPAGFTGSVARASTVATDTVILSVQKNGVEFGTLTFAPGTAEGVFNSISVATFNVRDVLTVVAPASPDASFGDAVLTIVPHLS